MTADDRFHRLRLIRSARIGPVSYRQLLARFGSARAALEAIPDLARRGGAKGVRLADPRTVDREIAATDKAGAQFIFLGEAHYPALLAQLADAPAVLICSGDVSLLDRLSVAIVGARNASASACRLARQLAAELAAEGVVSVSGLARGIDSAVHRGAIDGKTVAVIAGGIDNVYPPENAELQEEIATRALLVCEMPFGTEPRARHFPHRNRIIAGLSRGTVIVEAAPRSGSLITARMAGEAGREVMAIPGSPLDPRSRGCNGLIRDGATLVQSAEDIVEAVRGWSPESPTSLFEPQSHYEGRPRDSHGDEYISDAGENDRALVQQLLSANFVGVDELVRQVALPVESVQLCLLELELAGRIERGAGAKVRLAL